MIIIIIVIIIIIIVLVVNKLTLPIINQFVSNKAIFCLLFYGPPL